MIRMTALGILCWVHAAAAGTHSLQYFAVGTTEETGIPKYVEVDMVDDVQYMYYDSTMEKPTFRMDWMNKTMGPNFWERRIQYIERGHNMVKWSLSKTVQHFNHTGVHIYQSMGGCELDADGTRRTYASHAYDGKDFVSLDLETMTWIAALPQAVSYKRMREADTHSQQVVKHYFEHDCFKSLKMYIQNWREILQMKVCPEVMLIPRKARKSPGTDVICHVTGFYPREVEVNWVRDGEHLLDEGVWSGEVLPNGDRTYQLRKILTVSPEEQKKHSYSCQVDHASLDEKMDVKWVPEAALNMGFVAGGVLAALGLIIAVIIGVHIWKKSASGARSPDYTPAQTKEQSDASSNSSNPTNNDRCDPIAEKLMTQTE